jgi:hypothetical protein
MASVFNVSLGVGRASSGEEFAEVSYDIQFSGAEVSLNLEFDEIIHLFERDEAIDQYYQPWGMNLGVQWAARGNLDDSIGTVHQGTIQPNGQALLHRTHRREWSFPRNEKGAEEYRALVLVVPEIYRGSAWSNEVKIDLA